MKFNSSSQRNRIRAVEQVQVEVVETLRWPEVKNALGATALRLAHIAEFLYVPNVKNGKVSAPKERQKTDHIPILPIASGEEFILDESLKGMAPVQWDKMASILEAAIAVPNEVFGEYFRVASINGQLEESEWILETNGLEMALAGVAPATHAKSFDPHFFPGLRDNNKLAILGRPFIYVKPPKNEFQQEARNPILVHELVHVEQILSSPILPYDEDNYIDARWRQELEAYRVNTDYGNILLWSDDSRYWMRQGLRVGRIIEQIRKKYADPSDPYAPLPEIKDAVKRVGWGNLNVNYNLSNTRASSNSSNW
jgi:hypothetical protein